MIKYKITGLKIFQLLTAMLKKHQSNNRGTGEGTCLVEQRSNLFDNKIRKQQRSQKLLARYILNDHVKTLAGITTKRISTHFEEQILLPA